PPTLTAALDTEHLFDYEVTLAPPVAFGPTHRGTRMFYEVRGGRISGPALSGEGVGGGGDWALVGPDGWTRIHLPRHPPTDDGGLLCFTYRGVIEPTEALLTAMRSGGETSFEDQYWRVSIEVETGDPRYLWLTRSVLVGRGRLCQGPGVVYRTFRVC